MSEILSVSASSSSVLGDEWTVFCGAGCGDETWLASVTCPRLTVEDGVPGMGSMRRTRGDNGGVVEANVTTTHLEEWVVVEQRFGLPSEWDNNKPVDSSSICAGDEDSTAAVWFNMVGLGFGAVQALVQGSVAVVVILGTDACTSRAGAVSNRGRGRAGDANKSSSSSSPFRLQQCKLL